MRIISLIASATELVHALGLGDQLVGRSHECDYPPEVHDLPACTEPAFDVSGTSGEIDARIKALVAEASADPSRALSIYRVFGDALRKLAPDVILTQSQCEVCAVSLVEVERSLEGWIGTRPKLVSLAPEKLSDVWEDVQRVADALGVPEKGAALAACLKRRVEAIAIRAKGLAERPRVATLEWFEPLMAGGNWVPELVELAGGQNLIGEAGKHSPWMTWDELLKADPDVIVLLPCGFDLLRTRAEAADLAIHEGWAGLKAVQTGQVYITDGNAYFNRPGPRLVESLEILAEIMHPATFDFGHKGVAWEKL